MAWVLYGGQRPVRQEGHGWRALFGSGGGQAGVFREQGLWAGARPAHSRTGTTLQLTAQNAEAQGGLGMCPMTGGV